MPKTRNTKRPMSTTVAKLCRLLLHPYTIDDTIDASSELNVLVAKLYDEHFKELVLSALHPLHRNQHLDQKTNLDIESFPTNDDVWIFGYGSLVWKADFPYIDHKRGFICGYQRRFYQNSIDHRGTYAKPGRVVTLLPTGCKSDRVYGMAYRIAAHQKCEVLKHLDYREKNGYKRCMLQFQEFPEDKENHFDIIMYIATQENDSYAGEMWQLPRIADQIFTSAGPSGQNRDYLFHLANSMRMLFPGVKDDHLFELEQAVLHRIDCQEPFLLESSLKNQIEAIISIKEVESTHDMQFDVYIKQFEKLKQFCTQPGWKEALLTIELPFECS